MNVKSGTQTFSNSTTNFTKSDGTQTAQPEEFRKKFGEKSLGEVANQVADPNWVDPAKTRKVGNNSLDKDAFLKLMLTQMKNQDPANPMQSHEMAAQLAQFTSLEQLFNINETLMGMKKGQDPTQNFQALNFIGKMVSGDTSKVIRSANDKEHEVRFDLPTMAKDLKVQIKSPSGEVVRTYTLANVESGSQRIVWNGLKEDGLPARPGEYVFDIQATAANGSKLMAKTNFEGRITGVNYAKDGPVLLVGNQSIRLSDVKRIVEPSSVAAQPVIPMSPAQAQNAQVTKALDLSKQDKAVEDKRKGMKPAQNSEPDKEEMLSGSNLADVIMAGPLQERINQEMGLIGQAGDKRHE